MKNNPVFNKINIFIAICFSITSTYGCTSISYDVGDIKPKPVKVSNEQTRAFKGEKSGTGPRFDDSNPYQWEKRKPWFYPVHGTDVSKYQRDIDWNSVARSKISFVFIKATEGGDRVDDNFLNNWNAANQAGIARGAYHFYYFCRSAKDQAQWFIRNVPKAANALPPVLDMEWNHKSPTCKLRPQPEEIRRNMKIFLDIVEKHYGKRPIIYTTVDFFDHNNIKDFKGYPFWLRSVAGHPDEKYGVHPWVFWQYTGTGIIPGIEGNADINVFAGNREEWNRWRAQ